MKTESKVKAEAKEPNEYLEEKTKRSKNFQDSSSPGEGSSFKRPSKKPKLASYIKLESDETMTRIKNDQDISSYERPIKKSKVRHTLRESSSRGHDSFDDELEKKKAKSRKLAEAIETEKRLAKLQEEQRILDEEIEKEQQKKRQETIKKGKLTNPIDLD